MRQTKQYVRGHCRRDHMVVGFTTSCASVPITTNVASLNPIHDEVYSMQQYVINFVNNLQQVGGFLRVLWFPPPIKQTATL